MSAQVTRIGQPVDNHNDYRGNRQPLEFVPRTRLTRKHLLDECLAKRDLDIDWVIANCQSVTAEEASKSLGYTAKSDGILLKGWNEQIQFRPDVPWESVDENGKVTKPKYRSAKGAYDVMLPASPDDPDYWIDFDALKEKCFKVNGIPCLVLTEGMFKAIAGCSNGTPTVALLGVEMGLTPSKNDPDKERYLVTWLRILAARGFGFIIAFDADITTNKSVRLAQKNLYLKLKEKTEDVYIVSGFWSIEQGKGMDDYIQKNGADKFKKEVLEKALTLEAWEKQFSVDAQVELRSNSHPKPKPKDIAQKVADKFRNEWKYHNEQQIWRRFTGKIWESVGDNVFAEMTYQVVETICPNYEHYRTLDDVLKFLKLLLLEPKWQTFPRYQWIAFNDKVLNIETGETHEHAPGFRFLSHLPRNYCQIANDEVLNTIVALQKHCPNFYQTMMDVMGGDAQKVYKLAAIVNGVIGFKFFSLQMFVHLVGESGSGKGTFARILEKLVGENNAKQSSLPMLGNNPELAGIIDAQLVVCSDEDKQVNGHAPLKKLTGGHPIPYRNLHKPRAESYFFGTLVVISNFPIFAGDSTGLDRRLCLVHFDKPVPAHLRNPKIEELIEAELPALTSIALAMDSASVDEAIKGIGDAQIPVFRYREWEMKVQTDTLAAWMGDELISSPKDVIYIDESFDKYLEHAKDSNAKGTYKKQNFSENVLKHGRWLGVDCEKLPRDASGRMKIRGFRYRTDADYDVPLIGETLLSPHVDPCRPNVDPCVDLKPALGEGCVDYVDPTTNFYKTQQLPLEDIPSSNPEPELEPQTAITEKFGTGYTLPTQASPGKGFRSTQGSTLGLHGSTQEVEAIPPSQSDAIKAEPVDVVASDCQPRHAKPATLDEQPLTVGDVVTISCPGSRRDGKRGAIMRLKVEQGLKLADLSIPGEKQYWEAQVSWLSRVVV